MRCSVFSHIARPAWKLFCNSQQVRWQCHVKANDQRRRAPPRLTTQGFPSHNCGSTHQRKPRSSQMSLLLCTCVCVCRSNGSRRQTHFFVLALFSTESDKRLPSMLPVICCKPKDVHMRHRLTDGHDREGRTDKWSSARAQRLLKK